MPKPKSGKAKKQVQLELAKEEPKEEPKVKHYSVRMWANLFEVYACEYCDIQLQNEDDIILHTAGHFENEKREAVFHELLESKQKEG